MISLIDISSFSNHAPRVLVNNQWILLYKHVQVHMNTHVHRIKALISFTLLVSYMNTQQQKLKGAQEISVSRSQFTFALCCRCLGDGF